MSEVHLPIAGLVATIATVRRKKREENVFSKEKKLRVYNVQASPCGYEGKYCFRDMAWGGGVRRG
jgi:hypothetical protein